MGGGEAGVSGQQRQLLTDPGTVPAASMRYMLDRAL